MKQLLIVKKPAAFSNATPLDQGLTSHGVTDLSGLKDGAITFFELGAATSVYDSVNSVYKAPTKNFGIALGRPVGKGEMASGKQQLPFVIPEVDVDTLTVVKTLPVAGTHFSVAISLGNPTAGKTYTLRFYKKGVVHHERNKYAVTIKTAGNTSATYLDSNALVDAVLEAAKMEGFNLTATYSTTTVTITATDYTDWEVAAADDMPTSTVGTPTHAKKPVGDAAYVKNLAAQCAGDKGYFCTHADGREYIPGYPEDVENFTLNASGTTGNGLVEGCSTSGYAIYTLRFQVGRNSAKTRDEKVWQLVHIAIPVDSTGSYSQIADMDKILPEGDFSVVTADARALATANAQITSRVGASYRDA